MSLSLPHTTTTTTLAGKDVFDKSVRNFGVFGAKLAAGVCARPSFVPGLVRLCRTGSVGSLQEPVKLTPSVHFLVKELSEQ